MVKLFYGLLLIGVFYDEMEENESKILPSILGYGIVPAVVSLQRSNVSVNIMEVHQRGS